MTKLEHISIWQPLKLFLKANKVSKIVLILKEYQDFAVHIEKYKGFDQTIKILKDLNSKTKMAGANQRILDVSFGGYWLKVNSLGLPSKLPLLASLVNSDPRMANCITNLVTMYKLCPSSDISSITDEYTGLDIIPWYEEFKSYLKNIKEITKFPHPEIPKRYHGSVRSGPNGPAALIASGKDAIAITSDPAVFKTFAESCIRVGYESLLTKLCKFNLHHFIIGVVPSSPSFGFYKLSKLSYLADKAGKTRIVYSLDYWNQELLKPLHNAMFKWLKKQKQDGTFVQETAASQVKKWTAEGRKLYSFDLTAATDRWPKFMQKDVIRFLCSEEWAETWDNVLDIKPYSKPHNKYVKYSVGQPMGAYASWGALAVTHHMFIRFLAFKLGEQVEYVILGDDIVIANDKVGELYKQFTNDLGLAISERKSFLPSKQKKGSSAEFAKQTLVDGSDLTPISPILLNEIFEFHQWWKILDIIKYYKRQGLTPLRSSSEIWVPDPLDRFLKCLNKHERKLCLIFFSCPDADYTFNKVFPGDHGVVYDHPWKDIGDYERLTYRLDLVAEELSIATQKVKSLSDAINGGEGGTVLHGDLVRNPNHFVHDILSDVKQSLFDSYSTIANGDEPEGAVKLLTDSEFLNALLFKNVSYRQWEDSKSRLIRSTALLNIKLFKLCTTSQGTPPTEDYSGWY